jgi:hypothetical protein
MANEDWLSTQPVVPVFGVSDSHFP